MKAVIVNKHDWEYVCAIVAEWFKHHKNDYQCMVECNSIVNGDAKRRRFEFRRDMTILYPTDYEICLVTEPIQITFQIGRTVAWEMRNDWI